MLSGLSYMYQMSAKLKIKKNEWFQHFNFWKDTLCQTCSFKVDKICLLFGERLLCYFSWKCSTEASYPNRKKNFLNLQHWWLFVKIYMLDLVLEVKMHVWVSPWGKGLNKILSCLQNYVCARIFEAWTFILLTFAQIFIYKVSRWSLFLSKFMKGMKQKSWHQIWISFVSMSFKCFMVNYCQTFTGVYCVSMDKLYIVLLFVLPGNALN